MRDEGFRRLGILLGTVCAVCWVIFLAIGSSGFTLLTPRGWFVGTLGVAVSFLGPFALVRAIGWVARGFSGHG